MKEIALNILDITRNSVRAGAKKIRIEIRESDKSNSLVIKIIDNGCGIDEKMLLTVDDPFTTSRTTRKVGMGIALMKYHAELTGGKLDIESERGKGTSLRAEFVKDHIDRQPVGDICGIIKLLLISEKNIDFEYLHSTDEGQYEFSTKEAREVLEIDDLSHPGLAGDISNMLKENLLELNAEIT
ncbi:MAG: ATP-binding protein [bacterium]